MLIKDIQINIGNVCNNNCVFCVNQGNLSKNKKFIPLSDLKAQLLQYSRKHFNSIGFLGGEPTVYPQFIELIAYAKQVGFTHIHVVSNGRRLSDLAFVQALVRSGVTRLSVSIHADSAKVEDMLTRVPGSYRQKIEALKNLAHMRTHGYLNDGIAVNIVINSYNMRSLPRMLRSLRKYEVFQFRFNYCRLEGEVFQHRRELLPRYTDVLPVIKKMIIKNPKLPMSFEGIPLCLMHEIPGYLTYVGDLKDFYDRTFSFDKKDVRKFTEFSWAHERRNSLKKYAAQCKRCTLRKICEGIYWSYLKVHGSAEFIPVK